MKQIKILDTHTINKIAAGEVVERPSAVVKELVENSIDAKASSITVEIKGGGVDLIRITDNGIGIDKDQVEIAFLRHATSKITSVDDLEQVISLGFRGEALASIAAVAHVELLTKVRDQITGKRLLISGGKITESEEVACPDGTTFMMRHLFYNVPARKAFLGSSASETAKITDYMYKLALAHPEIAFKYICQSKTLFSTSGDHELKHCVLNIYGREYAKHTKPCYYKSHDIECVGLVGDPVLNRSNRNYEHFFINGRYIKSTILQNAVEDAYKTLAMVGKFPFVVLHLNMDPSFVDVNVHPTKLQVRFKNIDLIYKIVYEAVTQAFKEAFLVPDVQIDQPRGNQKIEPVIEAKQLEVETFFAPLKEKNEPSAASLLGENSRNHERILPETNPYKPSKQTMDRLFGESIQENVVPVYEDLLNDKKQLTEVVGEVLPAMGEVNSNQAMTTPPSVAPAENLPIDYQIIGQVFQTYWLIERQGKVFIIDQHAAHERILFEQFMSYFKEGNIATQLLLVPETLRVTPTEKVLLEEHEALFRQLGFLYESFGMQDIVLREVPYLLNEPLNVNVFKEVLDLMSQQKIQHLAQVRAEQIIRMSCRSAIKAHDRLTVRECEALIKALLTLENPFTCPHGRPTIVALSKGDIEKMFKRV